MRPFSGTAAMVPPGVPSTKAPGDDSAMRFASACDDGGAAFPQGGAGRGKWPGAGRVMLQPAWNGAHAMGPGAATEGFVVVQGKRESGHVGMHPGNAAEGSPAGHTGAQKCPDHVRVTVCPAAWAFARSTTTSQNAVFGTGITSLIGTVSTGPEKVRLGAVVMLMFVRIWTLEPRGAACAKENDPHVYGVGRSMHASCAPARPASTTTADASANDMYFT
jgi:hypothetical protein